MNREQFLNTQPGIEQSERIVDGVNYISNRFEIMAMEIAILNCWLKSPSLDKSIIHQSKLSSANYFLAKNRDELTDALMETAQLIKKLQDEITNKGIIGERNIGVENKA